MSRPATPTGARSLLSETKVLFSPRWVLFSRCGSLTALWQEGEFLTDADMPSPAAPPGWTRVNLHVVFMHDNSNS